MRIGILQTDSAPPELQPEFGDYPQMFKDLLTQANGGDALSFMVVDSQRGPYPDPAQCDAYIITGSRHSVYDGLPWIAELAAFAHSVLTAGRRVVGICFGHQLMAHYFGGKAERAAGWAVGVHSSRILVDAPWLAPAAEVVNLLSSHQDQVTALPPGAELIATNAFCPLAGFFQGNQVLTLQGHPEFQKGYARELINRRRELLGEAVWRAGIDSLVTDTHEGLVGRWILNFCGAKID